MNRESPWRLTSSTVAAHSSTSYPVNSVTASVFKSRARTTSLLRAARARSRCSSISLLNRSISISRPRSSASRAVRSMGNPYVSYSLKANSPLTFPAEAVSASNNSRPRSSVSLKLASSRFKTSFTVAARAASSGNTCPKDSTSVSTSSAKNGWVKPRRRP